MLLRALVRLAFVSTASIGVLHAQDSGWLLTNVQIVDLERGSVLDARTLHIRDDRIAAIVESPAAVPVAGLRTIDGQGSFMIPGLYDMHVHLVTNGDERPGLVLEGGVLPDRVLSSSARHTRRSRRRRERAGCRSSDTFRRWSRSRTSSRSVNEASNTWAG